MSEPRHTSPHDLRTTAEAARYLGLRPATLRNMRHRGTIEIAYYKIGGRVMYDRRDLDKYLEQQRVEPTTAQ